MMRRFAALVAALGTTLLLSAPAFAAPLTNPLPIVSDATGFGGGDCAGVEPGQVVWHFVANSSDQFETLSVSFANAGVMPDLVADIVTDTYELEWFVTTGSPDTLVDAVTSGDGNLQLLHICHNAAPTVDLTVNPVGSFNKFTGSATISGTVTCSGEPLYTKIDVQLQQRVGRFTILGADSLFPEAFVCDGTTQPWSIEVFGITGQFKGGRASAVASAYACSDFACGFDEEQAIVKLH